MQNEVHDMFLKIVFPDKGAHKLVTSAQRPRPHSLAALLSAAGARRKALAAAPPNRPGTSLGTAAADGMT